MKRNRNPTNKTNKTRIIKGLYDYLTLIIAYTLLLAFTLSPILILLWIFRGILGR